MNYHININGATVGPFGEEELQAKIRSGEITATTNCWAEGWPQWRQLGEVCPHWFPSAPPPPPPGANPNGAPPVQPRQAGLAIASLILALVAFMVGMPLSLLFFPFLLLFYPALIIAVILGHVARSKIKKSRGALTGAGLALAGLILGYSGIVVVPIPPLLFVGALAGSAALPAFQKVRTESAQKTMNNDARQIASAAQQYFMENATDTVDLAYNPNTGKIGGPLETYVPVIQKGYTNTPSRLAIDANFVLAHPTVGASTYNAEGQRIH